MALVEQLDAQLAAIWHWYLPLCICVHFLKLKKRRSFCPFRFFVLFVLYILFLFLSGIDKLDGMVDGTSMT